MHVKNIDTAHTDAIHDAKLDPSGMFLATSSSDCTVRVCDVSGSRILDVLQGHNGPVWSVSWAPTSVGGLMLASGAYDGKVIVWLSKPVGAGGYVKFEKAFEQQHGSSVNCVAWAPAEAGNLILAVACSDGSVVVLRRVQSPDGHPMSFVEDKLLGAHGITCYAVSWSPSGSDLVSGGFDNLIKIWRFDGDVWKDEVVLTGHNAWVRDVQWNPNSEKLIASCSDDATVRIWEMNHEARNSWSPKVIDFSSRGTPWQCSWSPCGDFLAVTCGEGAVSLWYRDMITGNWVQKPKVAENCQGEKEAAVAHL